MQRPVEGTGKRNRKKKQIEERDVEEVSREISQETQFVEVTKGMGIDVQMQYPLLGMQHGEKRCFMRREVFERLLKARSFLPEGLYLRIWDAWRPFALQQELYEVYPKIIIEQFHLENASEEERKAVIGEYLATPNPDRKCPPCHTTGGALDVTLIDAEGRELNMGTEFDAFSPMANTDYFEKLYERTVNINASVDVSASGCNLFGEQPVWSLEEITEIRNNRRILLQAMEAAGFANVSSEWWHYGYGERNWAADKGKAVLYEGVFEVEEIVG